jgi:hypothetical protein
MWCSFSPIRFCAIPFCLLILTIWSASNATAQTTDPKFLSGPEFILSPEALAAGIDGMFKVTLTVDETGSVKGVRLYGEPIWPCGTSPKRELEAVRNAVEKHLLLLKFSPSLKNGKPRSFDVILEFAIGKAFRRAVAADDAKMGLTPTLVKAGSLNGRAIHLERPLGAPTKGIAQVQVLVDEEGNVSKAGVFTGDRLLSSTLRQAACASKFSPTAIGGKPVRVTGLITYFIQ